MAFAVILTLATTSKILPQESIISGSFGHFIVNSAFSVYGIKVYKSPKIIENSGSPTFFPKFGIPPSFPIESFPNNLQWPMTACGKELSTPLKAAEGDKFSPKTLRRKYRGTEWPVWRASGALARSLHRRGRPEFRANLSGNRTGGAHTQ